MPRPCVSPNRGDAFRRRRFKCHFRTGEEGSPRHWLPAWLRDLPLLLPRPTRRHLRPDTVIFSWRGRPLYASHIQASCLAGILILTSLTGFVPFRAPLCCYVALHRRFGMTVCRNTPGRGVSPTKGGPLRISPLAVVRPPTVSSLAVTELTRRSYLVRSALRGILQIGFPCFAVVRTHEQIRFPRFSGAA